MGPALAADRCAASTRAAARPVDERPVARPARAEPRPAPVHREACPSDRSPGSSGAPHRRPAAPRPDLAAAHRHPEAQCHPVCGHRRVRRHAAAGRDRHCQVLRAVRQEDVPVHRCQVQDHRGRNRHRDALARAGVGEVRLVSQRIPQALVPLCADRVPDHLAPAHPRQGTSSARRPASARWALDHREPVASRPEVHRRHRARSHHPADGHRPQPCPVQGRLALETCRSPGRHPPQVPRSRWHPPEAFHQVHHSRAHRSPRDLSATCRHQEARRWTHPQAA